MAVLPIIPYPNRCEIKSGMLDCSNGFDLEISSIDPDKLDILYTLFPAGEVKLYLDVDPELGNSYEIACDKDGVRVKVKAQRYVCPSMLCLYQVYFGLEGKLPYFSIEDNPSYAYRGFMLDCSRHFFPVTFIKKVLFFMSMYRLNYFHWHLSDDQGIRFAVPGLELEKASRRLETMFSNPDSFYTQGIYSEKDLSSIVEYASTLGIEVIPEFETPGHASALLSVYPELGCFSKDYKVQDTFGIFPDVLCPGKEKVFEVLDKIIAYLSSIFPCKYIHLGGDECPTEHYKQCPDCQALMKREGLKDESELQGYFTMRVNQIAKKYHKTSCGWNEVLYRQGPYELDPDTLVYCWQGRQALEYHKSNPLVLCPNTEALYLDYRNAPSANEPGNLGVSKLSDIYKFEAGDESTIMGIQANLWTEVVFFGRWAEYMIFPRLAAVSEISWTRARDYQGFLQRLDKHKDLLDKYDINYCKILC